MRNQEQFNQSIREGNHIDAVKILDENGLISLRKSRTRQNFTDDVLLSARVTHLGDNLYGVGVCYNSYYYMINQSLWEQHPDNGVHDRFDGEVMLVDLEKGVLKSQKIDSSDKQIDWDSSLNWRLEKMGYKHFLTSYQTAVAQEKRNEEQIKKDLLVKFGEEDIFGFDPKINGIQFVPLTEDDKYACFGAYMTIPFKDTNVPEVEYVNRHLIAVVGLCEGNKIVKMKQWDKDAYRFFITERNGVQSTFEREFIGEPKVEVSGGICRMTPRILEKPTFFADSVDKMEGKKELSEQIGFAVPETIRKPRTAEKDSKTDSKEETTKANTSERVREYLKKQLNATEVSDVIGVKLENGYTAFGTYAKQNGKVSCMTVYCRDDEVLAVDSALIAKGACPRLDGISVNYSDGFPSVVKIDSTAGSRTFSVPQKIIEGMKTGNHPAPITEQKAAPVTPQEASKPKEVSQEQVQNYLLEKAGVSEISELLPIRIGKNIGKINDIVVFGGYTKKDGKVRCTLVYCKGGEIIDTTNVSISANSCPNPNGVAVYRNPPMVEVSYQGRISEDVTRMFLYGMMSREEALRRATVTTKIPIPRKVRKSMEQETTTQNSAGFWARLFRWGGNGGNG